MDTSTSYALASGANTQPAHISNNDPSELPEDINCLIFSLLNIRDIGSYLSVCKSLSEINLSEKTWRILLQRDFKWMINSSTTNLNSDKSLSISSRDLYKKAHSLDFLDLEWKVEKTLHLENKLISNIWHLNDEGALSTYCFNDGTLYTWSLEKEDIPQIIQLPMPFKEKCLQLPTAFNILKRGELLSFHRNSLTFELIILENNSTNFIEYTNPKNDKYIMGGCSLAQNRVALYYSNKIQILDFTDRHNVISCDLKTNFDMGIWELIELQDGNLMAFTEKGKVCVFDRESGWQKKKEGKIDIGLTECVTNNSSGPIKMLDVRFIMDNGEVILEKLLSVTENTPTFMYEVWTPDFTKDIIKFELTKSTKPYTSSNTIVVSWDSYRRSSSQIFRLPNGRLVRFNEFSSDATILPWADTEEESRNIKGVSYHDSIKFINPKTKQIISINTGLPRITVLSPFYKPPEQTKND